MGQQHGGRSGFAVLLSGTLQSRDEVTLALTPTRQGVSAQGSGVGEGCDPDSAAWGWLFEVRPGAAQGSGERKDGETQSRWNSTEVGKGQVHAR